MEIKKEFKERSIRKSLEKDLNQKKMVFIGGPRQVGKTTLALSFLKDSSAETPHYLTWDHPEHRTKLLKLELPNFEKFLVFDEIHKYVHWRNLIKGAYDIYKDKYRFIVTGSARLDFYSRGGDSLTGRYHYHRLHPWSLREFDPTFKASALDHLLTFSGFPEPLFRGNLTEHRRWQRERMRTVIRDDLRDLEQIRELGQLELLVGALPARVGSPLSIKNLAEDLSVAHKTISRWLEILCNLYVAFNILPWSGPKIRAVKKEQKYYLWDWSQCEESGARFENLVASQLLKYCQEMEDREGYAMELRYIRDTDKREIDFVVLKDSKPQFAVECKVGERSLSKAIPYFMERTNIPLFFQVHLGTADFGDPSVGGRVMPFRTFCSEMNMP